MGVSGFGVPTVGEKAQEHQHGLGHSTDFVSSAWRGNEHDCLPLLLLIISALQPA